MDDAKPSRGAGSPATIFVVDDEPMLLDLAAAILKPAGFEVRTFRDPKAALAEFAAAQPLVLVTDFSMADMSGLELVHRCRQINPRQKILLMSGTVNENIYAQDADKPDAFLAKPYQVRDFVGCVQKLAGG
jgi:CheY-like chemotaxis protein